MALPQMTLTTVRQASQPRPEPRSWTATRVVATAAPTPQQSTQSMLRTKSAPQLARRIASQASRQATKLRVLTKAYRLAVCILRQPMQFWRSRVLRTAWIAPRASWPPKNAPSSVRTAMQGCTVYWYRLVVQRSALPVKRVICVLGVLRALSVQWGHIAPQTPPAVRTVPWASTGLRLTERGPAQNASRGNLRPARLS